MNVAPCLQQLEQAQPVDVLIWARIRAKKRGSFEAYLLAMVQRCKAQGLSVAIVVGQETQAELLEMMAQAGVFTWVTILYEDASGNDAHNTTAQSWYEDFPTPWVPVISDVDQRVNNWLQNTGIPTGNIVDENMTLLTHSNRGIAHAVLDQHIEEEADKAKACSLDSQYC